MTYATRTTEAGIELWSSDRDDATPPAGFVACDCPAFRRAWSERDYHTIEAMLPRPPLQQVYV